MPLLEEAQYVRCKYWKRKAQPGASNTRLMGKVSQPEPPADTLDFFGFLMRRFEKERQV